ncbi:MAG TPA: hypothetical protein VKQ30_20660 [Ktedonobacterales bacterium]|nr:hypothetical protein [Ktedonobacterales bacterium]
MSIGSSKLYYLREGVKLFYHRAARISVFGLSYEEAKDIFINPTHLAMMGAIVEAWGFHGKSGFVFDHEGAAAKFDDPPDNNHTPFPRYMGHEVFQPEHKALHRLKAHMEHHKWLKLEFARAYHAIDALACSCGSLRQMAYIFPATIPLLNIHGEASEAGMAAAMLTGSKPPSSIPVMNTEFKDALVDAAGAITRTQLIASDYKPDTPWPLKAEITVAPLEVDVNWRIGSGNDGRLSVTTTVL